ncbi:MAG: hypothetical protein ABIQ17_03185 [Candidatus Limnocylindrales bacterium]
MTNRPMTQRRHRAILSAAALAAALIGGLAGPAGAHGPDPSVGGTRWAPNQALKYQWRSGQTPPSWMTPAIDAAAADATRTRASRAATFSRVSSGSASLVAYGEPTGCSPAGIACFSRAGAPSYFLMWFRAHGHVFDWGSLRWCQALTTLVNGCFDVENVALDEFGHVEILGHHVNLADGSDYRDAVVQTVARARPAAGWQDHAFARCDTARLQLEYDRQSPRDLFSSCLAIPTTLVLSANPTSTWSGGSVTLTATLRTTSASSNGALASDPVSGRTVTLQRRTPGTATWSAAGTLSPSSSVEGSYALTLSAAATYEWRAVFSPVPGDGALAATSGVIKVIVGTCAQPTCAGNRAKVATARFGGYRS